MSSKVHPSSEELLRHLDGENHPAEARIIAEHLQQCWKCRAHADELQEQIHRVTRSLQSERWPSADHQELAHRHLQSLLKRESTLRSDSLTHFDASLPQTSEGSRGFGRWMLASGLAAALALLVWIAVPPRLSWIPAGEAALTSRDIPHAGRTTATLRLARWQARNGWTELQLPVVRGTIAVQLAEASLPGPRRWHTVNWVVDRSSGRSAWRWVENRGQVHLAAWSPASAPTITYLYREKRWTPYDRSGGSTVTAHTFSRLALAPNDADILAWLHGQLGRDASPVRRFIELASTAGSTVRYLPSGKRVTMCVRLQNGDASFQDCLEGDPRTGEIFQELIRVRSSRRQLFLRIPWSTVTEELEGTAVFTSFLPPGLPALDADFAALVKGPEVPPSPLRDLREARLLSAMVAAEETLEWLGVYGGAGIDIQLHNDATHIAVSGRVSTREQRDLVAKKFSEAIVPELLKLHFHSGDDAPLPAQQSTAGITHSGAAKPAALRYIERAFPEWSPEEIRSYCNRTVGISAQIVAEAAALAKLSERIPASAEKLLSPEDQGRLRGVRFSRAARLRANAQVLQEHLAAIGPGFRSATSPLEAMPADDLARFRTAAAVSRNARDLHAQVLALFAVGGPRSAETEEYLESMQTKIALLLGLNPSADAAARN